MGRVVAMEEYRARAERRDLTLNPAHPTIEAERSTAYFLIMRASELLSGLGADEERVSWMLEDCAVLLQSPLKKIQNATREV